MQDSTANFVVLTKYEDIQAYLEDVKLSADKHRNALGFFPEKVYWEYARKDRLYICVARGVEAQTYAGHLLFDCSFPKCHIRQMFVKSSCRRNGLASLLLEQLKQELVKLGYIAIYARVAEDLVEANRFWDRQQFYVQRIAPGGKSKNRSIVVRTRELDSPQLFPPSDVTMTNPLGLDNAASGSQPLFLLDLNVLFDLGPRRIRHEEAIGLFQIERTGICQFAISSELRKELDRTAGAGGKTDPMLAYTLIFPVLPFRDSENSEKLLDALATIVFPSRSSIGKLTSNDKSDLRHLAIAVQHRIAGFITNDGAILRASTHIEEQFGIQVVSPLSFRSAGTDIDRHDGFDTPGDNTLILRSVTHEDDVAVFDLLKKLDVSGSDAVAAWSTVDVQAKVIVRQGVWVEDRLLGYLTYPTSAVSKVIVGRIAVDESDPQSANAARALLTHMLDRVSTQGPVQVQLTFPACQVLVREVAWGLRGSGDEATVTKLVLARIVTEQSWSQCCSSLIGAGGPHLPENLPVFRGIDQQMQLLTANGHRVFATLEMLETLLAPALFCLRGRQAVVTPVQRNFADLLLGHSRQTSLLPQSKAALFREKHYLSSSRTFKHFARGTLILFYESTKHGGQGAVVAIARVQRAYLRPQEAMAATDLDQSIFDPDNLDVLGKSSLKTVAVFDNTMCFPNPVPLQVLKRIGCGRPTDLLTTRPVTDEQFQAIVSEGLGFAP